MSTEVLSSNTDPLYNGDTIVLTCTISLEYDISTPTSILSVTTQWQRNSQLLITNDSRIATELLTDNSTSFTSILNISVANDSIDTGEYRCTAQVRIADGNAVTTILANNASFALIVDIAPEATSEVATMTLTSTQVNTLLVTSEVTTLTTMTSTVVTQVTSQVTTMTQTTSEATQTAPPVVVMTTMLAPSTAAIAGDNLDLILTATGAVLFVVLAIIVTFAICGVVIVKFKKAMKHKR